MSKILKSQLGLAPIIIVLIVVGALLLGAGAIYLYQQSKVGPEPEVTQPITDEITNHSKKMTIKIPVIDLGGGFYSGDKIGGITIARETGDFIGCGDRIIFVEKEIPHTTKPLTAIYQELFRGSEIVEGTKYSNPIAWHNHERVIQRTNQPDFIKRALQFDKVIVEDGITTVYLVGDYMSIGTCEPPRVMAALEFAAKQYPWIKEVRIYIENAEAEGVIFHGGRDPVLWGWNYCSLFSCSVGQGDCDTDAECNSGLFCAQNVGVKYGQVDRMDVCEKRFE